MNTLRILRILRLLAHLLLAAIFIQIADGPFAVESEDKKFFAGVFMQASGPVADAALPDPAADPFHSHGSIDEMYTDLADMPRHAMSLQAARRNVQGLPVPHSFSSAAVIPLYRPPLNRLS